MKHIYFATGEEHKFDEASEYLTDTCPEVTLDRLDVDVMPVFSNDRGEVLRHKVDQARRLTRLPFIVDDTLPNVEDLQAPSFDVKSKRNVANVALHYLGTTHNFVAGPESTAFGRLGEWVHAQNSLAAAQKLQIGDRWTQRSSGWKDIIEDDDSYVNFEQNYARVNAMIETLAPLVSGGVLEIGCGTGEAGRILKKANPSLDVLSTDIADGMLAQAVKQTLEAGLDISYKKLDIVADELGERSFDLVLSRGVIVSHLPRTDVLDWFEAVTKHTNPNGYFLFDFIQSVQVGDVEKPVDSKNEFTLGQMDEILGELGWNRVASDGTDQTRVQVVCYRRAAQ